MSAGEKPLDRWRRQLEARRIPDEILDAAPESPYGFSPELFRSRAAEVATSGPTPSTRRALEALPEGGSVLDVGYGAGAASLPLCERAGQLIGVDESQEMLDELVAAVPQGVGVEVHRGAWPDVAARVPAADVVVCHHVLYNVPELATFVRELDGHARRRVVVEITGAHPIWWMSDLWERFHGLPFPAGPTADDAVAALGELGIVPGREDRTQRGPRGGFARREDAIGLVRRRLCLPADRDPEVASALGDRLREHGGLWSAGPSTTTLVTLWWDRT